VISHSLLRTQTTAQPRSRVERRFVGQCAAKAGARASPASPTSTQSTRSTADAARTLAAQTPSAERQALFPVRYPDILYLRGVPQEFFALSLFSLGPVAALTMGNPGCLQVTG
jgi:hypothetical protein